MGNKILTPTVIAKEALMQLNNNLVMGGLVHTDYKNEFVKIGSSVTIRKPVKFKVTDGAILERQDVVEESTSITVDKRKHVAWAFDTQTLTLSIEEYSERYIKPAVIQLANQVDMDLTGLYVDVNRASGSAGTTPATFAALGDAARVMDDLAVPDDLRRLVLNPKANWSLADAFKGLYWTKKVEEVVKRGYLGNVANFDIYSSQNIKKHTTGTWATSGTIQVKTAPTSGATEIKLKGFTEGGTIKVGDVFTIATVYAVNPITRQATADLQQFTVTEEEVADSSGYATVKVSPAIVYVDGGARNTVDSLPAVDDNITKVANHIANLAFHKNAFALVTVPLEMPDSVGFKARLTENGISIRVLKDYDIVNDEETIRLDIMYGVKTIYPDLAVRLLG